MIVEYILLLLRVSNHHVYLWFTNVDKPLITTISAVNERHRTGRSNNPSKTKVVTHQLPQMNHCQPLFNQHEQHEPIIRHNQPEFIIHSPYWTINHIPNHSINQSTSQSPNQSTTSTIPSTNQPTIQPQPFTRSWFQPASTPGALQLLLAEGRRLHGVSPAPLGDVGQFGVTWLVMNGWFVWLNYGWLMV